jgi:hypothetical protein
MTTDKRTVILNQLKAQVINQLDDLIAVCPNEGDILLVRFFFENNIDPQSLMDGFIYWVLPWKDYIQKRDERFFIENNHVFGPLPESKVAYFKQKFLDGTFDAADKEIIWQYFHVYVSLMEQYNKLQ